MILEQIIHFITSNPTLNQFKNALNQLVQNVDGGDGDYRISLLSLDKHLVFVEYRNNKLVGSTSKKVN
jgi:hypothetical protein